MNRKKTNPKIGINNMRKSAILLTSLILSATLLFAGCAQYPDLTEEENEMVSEYAVSLLLKYDKDNHSRLVDTSEFLNKYNTALQERESARLAYEAAKQLEEETRRKEAQEQEAANGGYTSQPVSPSNDGTGGATVIDSSESVMSVEQFLDAEDFSIKYAGLTLTDSYPENSTDYFFAMNALENKKLLVVFFDVTNNGAAQQFNVYARNVTFKLNINNQGYKSVYKNLLEDSLDEYLGDFNSGETKRLVLIYEVPADTVVSSLSMMVSSNTKGSVTSNLE